MKSFVFKELLNSMALQVSLITGKSALSAAAINCNYESRLWPAVFIIDVCSLFFRGLTAHSISTASTLPEFP